MFGISGEHLLILGIVLLIFGPRRLPELGNTLGKAIRNFKDAVTGVEEAKFRKLNENETRNSLPPEEKPATAESTVTPESAKPEKTSPPEGTPV